jgi:hypothetical protein
MMVSHQQQQETWDVAEHRCIAIERNMASFSAVALPSNKIKLDSRCDSHLDRTHRPHQKIVNLKDLFVTILALKPTS